MSRRCRAGAAALVMAALLGACSGDSGRQAASSTTSGRAGPTPEPPERTCDQGATVDEVESQPIDGVPSDHTVTSFDGTQIRIHWFPTDRATAEEPAETVLMGPGWSLAGDTSSEGAPLFGALAIGPMNEAGYNVLTWDPRGFGESTGSAQVNSPEAEGRDVQLLLDWVAEQPGARTDADGDPRVGMVGFSYGGGIQLTVAAIDCRVDAIVPGLAWHSLETSLYKSETVKTGWAGVLVDAAATGTVDPHVTSAHRSGVDTGTLSSEDHEWFLERGPAELVQDIEVPTLLVHGTTDTLFTLDEAITNYEILRERDVPVAMLWFCGGHGTCRTDEGDEGRVGERTFAWLDRYVKDDATVDVGPGFEFVDQDGTTWTADHHPVEAGEPLTAEGGGILELRPDGGAELSEPLQGGEILDGLVSGITPGPATNAVEVRIAAPSEPTVVLGAPRLSLTYRGAAEPGDRPTRVFAQLVDDERGVVVGNQITPMSVNLDGESHTIEVDLEVVAQHLEPGRTLTLQIVAATGAYATPRMGGQVTIEQAAITLPTAAPGGLHADT